MEVFAIIVIYNGLKNDWVRKCFESILRSSIPVKIIAVDNGSSDGSIEFIEKNYPQIELIVLKNNLGFGKANNIGLKKALDLNGQYFFLLNQDARVDDLTIETLIKQSRKNPEYGIISPLHLNGRGDALDYNFSMQISPNKCVNLYSDFVLGSIKEKLYDVNFVCAASWLLTKECLRLVGGFSPAFFHYGEDDNFTHRVKYENLKVGIYPHVNIYHDRAEREKTSYDDKEFAERRDALILYSNPNFNHDIRSRIKTLKIQIFKANLQLKSSKILRKELSFLKSCKLKVITNLEISKKNINYKFLEI